MKNLLFISKPTSWGNKSVQVRQAVFFKNVFCGDYPIFLNFFNQFSNAKHEKQQGSTRY